MDHVAPSCSARRVVEVLENVPIARDTYRMRLADPEMAKQIRPGQFLMVRPSLGPDPLLGRPFALYDVIRNSSGEPNALDVVYFVLGRGTQMLSRVHAGDRLEVWGPLGNGFADPPDGEIVCVAGGIGQTPFLALGKWWMGSAKYSEIDYSKPLVPSKVSLLWGVRSADLLAGLNDFRSAGIEVEIATDDGSAGHRGFVTELLKARLATGQKPIKIIGCGPPLMLKVVASIAENAEIDCDLSLENHMACGFGACFSCVTPIRQADGTADLRRVCVEGPIFDARTVIFA